MTLINASLKIVIFLKNQIKPLYGPEGIENASRLVGIRFSMSGDRATAFERTRAESAGDLIGQCVESGIFFLLRIGEKRRLWGGLGEMRCRRSDQSHRLE